MKRQKKFSQLLDEKIDDINWEIAMFFKHGLEPDGIFANIIVPCLVSMVVAVIVTLIVH